MYPIKFKHSKFIQGIADTVENRQLRKNCQLKSYYEYQKTAQSHEKCRITHCVGCGTTIESSYSYVIHVHTSVSYVAFPMSPFSSNGITARLVLAINTFSRMLNRHLKMCNRFFKVKLAIVVSYRSAKRPGGIHLERGFFWHVFLGELWWTLGSMDGYVGQVTAGPRGMCI